MNNKIKVELELNEYQIELIQNWAERAADNLHDQCSEWGDDALDDYKEDHRTIYGTDNYEEAQALLEDIKNQLRLDDEFTQKEKRIFFYCNRRGNIKDLEKFESFPAGATSRDVQKAFEQWLKSKMDIGWSEQK